ncbi:type I restriction enzyme HsdR N-terminal domain-containing protein [Lysinibacillus sp. NPDC094403]|uniref:type I restriction enzyme HsdR N-terminal domain-containing protein n=1 Tax=Lysinibacillus sp. NPDC094403 TaxID=3390581 RepID=UPI003D05688C
MSIFTLANSTVLCPIREYRVVYTPEERVRQKLLKQLLASNASIKPFIALEVNTALGRADIVISDEQHQPFLIIELKKNTEVISQHTLEQVMRYWETLKAPFVATSNGSATHIYHVVDGQPKEIQETNIIRFLANQQIDYPTYMPLQRLTYDLSTYDRYLHYLVDTSYISENTTDEKQKWFAELQNALFTEKYEPTNRSLPITIEADFGTSYYAFKNAANGSWDGMHRNFRVHIKRLGSFMFRITIMGSASTKNDPTFGNRTGATHLNIAMQRHHTSTYNLQLSLDKFTQELDDMYLIWHSGVKSRTKKEIVQAAVSKFAPQLIIDGQIQLGILPTTRSISAQEFSHFIENLILYSTARDLTK